MGTALLAGWAVLTFSADVLGIAPTLPERIVAGVSACATIGTIYVLGGLS